MRKLILSLSLLSGLLGFASADQESARHKEAFHVYLLIGQSNMAGRAAFSEEEAKPLEKVYLLNAGDNWEPARNPLNRYSTIRKGLGMQKLNPGYSFSQAIAAKNQSNRIGLVVNAKGGTKIEQWAKGTRFYKEAVRRALIATETGTLKGILWHQGESNHGKPHGYAEKLAQLVEDLREDLGNDELPFVAGQIIGPSPINQEIARLPELCPHTAVASSESLETYDRWHFDTESVKELGRRYAEAMQTLTEKP
ncbi:sialate O-acetylesterase [Coraliomargarita sinensis]|uniref:Sialate O-acetylesterase n=1 Tax=Coraliomargarita sinensis TaxID=2174842 RepID=A0A317ZI44_9BACT|nr:sialate O-acetylesterase [Coraliomargarita sinensis]PXA03041.1 sialate O-acetylesterase [Coraliomargarita sinensis]